MDKKKISSLVDYGDYDDEECEPSNELKSESHSQDSRKTKSGHNLDKSKEKPKDEKNVPHRSRDSRHSPHSERESRDGSKSGTNNSNSSHYDRSDRHSSRRRDERSMRDTDDRSKRREYSSYDHNNDRRDSHRRSRKRYSRSRSRSRSRERHSHQSSSRRDESRSKYHSRNEKTSNESKTTKDRAQQVTNTMQLMHEQIKAKTGVTVPKYYNPAVVNPIKFAEQEQKRKLLWSRDDTKKVEEKKEESDKNKALWNNLRFEGDNGKQKISKFKKLMGIRDDDCVGSNSTKEETTKNASVIEKQETLFRNLDMQYAIARMSTHTHRGVGLGFGTSQSISTSTTSTSVEHN